MIAETSLIRINPGLLSALNKGGLHIDVFSQELVVLECLVAGTSFRCVDKIDAHLLPAAKLSIRREVNNEYDQFAVSLMFEETKVGYIPKNKNEVIARLMDAGKSFYARIEEKDWEGSWLRLKIKVVMKD